MENKMFYLKFLNKSAIMTKIQIENQKPNIKI